MNRGFVVLDGGIGCGQAHSALAARSCIGTRHAVLLRLTAREYMSTSAFYASRHPLGDVRKVLLTLLRGLDTFGGIELAVCTIWCT